MADIRSDQGADGKVRRLSDAVRKVRISEAERTDAVSDLHDAERARLSMLADELKGVFSEIPADDDFFICQTAGSNPPRLWIDPTSHVVIGRDRRTYRFLKDTRLGRVVIGEHADVHRMADLVTDYVAERVVERDRAVETDHLMERLRLSSQPRPAETPAPALAKPARPEAGAGLAAVVALLFGIAIGAIGIIGYAWFRAPM